MAPIVGSIVDEKMATLVGKPPLILKSRCNPKRLKRLMEKFSYDQHAIEREMRYGRLLEQMSGG